MDEDEEFAYVDQLLAEQVSHEYAEIASDELQAERAGLLNGFLAKIATNSLLAQVGLIHDGSRVSVVPMHANSVHDLDCGSDLMLVRPARIGAATQWGRFRIAVEELEELLNTAGVKRKKSKRSLKNTPSFCEDLITPRFIIRLSSRSETENRYDPTSSRSP
jgi:hypothetical protein